MKYSDKGVNVFDMIPCLALVAILSNNSVNGMVKKAIIVESVVFLVLVVVYNKKSPWIKPLLMCLIVSQALFLGLRDNVILPYLDKQGYLPKGAWKGPDEKNEDVCSQPDLHSEEEGPTSALMDAASQEVNSQEVRDAKDTSTKPSRKATEKKSKPLCGCIDCLETRGRCYCSSCQSMRSAHTQCPCDTCQASRKDCNCVNCRNSRLVSQCSKCLQYMPTPAPGMPMASYYPNYGPVPQFATPTPAPTYSNCCPPNPPSTRSKRGHNSSHSRTTPSKKPKSAPGPNTKPSPCLTDHTSALTPISDPKEQNPSALAKLSPTINELALSSSVNPSPTPLILPPDTSVPMNKKKSTRMCMEKECVNCKPSKYDDLNNCPRKDCLTCRIDWRLADALKVSIGAEYPILHEYMSQHTPKERRQLLGWLCEYADQESEAQKRRLDQSRGIPPALPAPNDPAYTPKTLSELEQLIPNDDLKQFLRFQAELEILAQAMVRRDYIRYLSASPLESDKKLAETQRTIDHNERVELYDQLVYGDSAYMSDSSSMLMFGST
ncbi:hypothetical protein NEHOM01_1190 [Nematocida homosporus]|uniref:uncharacterized protein n=1 Tax=Nematocida homosporus TaxID=1912981 RepID=UPI00222010DB|nr:uncharacterized protein NEHOM01_1190 [Nematocida homosporus]KAI5185967.1 hypothetical protein NEHOM01_1190 [Nematocida homosporus]